MTEVIVTRMSVCVILFGLITGKRVGEPIIIVIFFSLQISKAKAKCKENKASLKGYLNSACFFISYLYLYSYSTQTTEVVSLATLRKEEISHNSQRICSCEISRRLQNNSYFWAKTGKAETTEKIYSGLNTERPGRDAWGARVFNARIGFSRHLLELKSSPRADVSYVYLLYAFSASGVRVNVLVVGSDESSVRAGCIRTLFQQ